MSKEKSLFTAIEWNGRTLNVLGYIPAAELKKIAEDFENGIEVKHEQVKVVDGELVRPKLLAMVGEKPEVRSQRSEKELSKWNYSQGN